MSAGEQMNVVVEPVQAKVRNAPLLNRAKALFLGAAGLSFLLSVSLFFTGDHERGIYVGIWVPSILSAGTLLMSQDAK